MKRYSEKERLDTENTIIALVRDYNHQGMLNLLISHGIDTAKYFHDPINRKVFNILLKMNAENIPIFPEPFLKYINEKYESGFESKKMIFERFMLNSANANSYLSSHNAEFFIWRFKEMIIEDYWNHIFQMEKNDTWKTNDLIERSWYIVDNFTALWNRIAKKFEQNNDDAEESKQSLREKVNNQRAGKSTSCKTGLTEFDEFTGGFENSELYLIAARPSMGKTTFALSLIKRMLFLGKRVHFFTLEMTREQIVNRFISEETKIPYRRIKSGNLSDEELELIERYIDFYDNHELLVIDELPNNTLTEFVDRCLEVDSDIRFVDYLQLLKNDEGVKAKLGNREQEVSNISQTLKRMAKKLKNPMVALSQLSRSVEGRNNKRPILADLRESGSLEQDADVIIFLYRDAYYRKLLGQIVQDYEEGNIEVIIGKGREIGTGDFKMYLDLINSRVYENFRYSA